MRHATKITCLIVAATAVIVGCNSLIDDPSGPKVVMEVENVTIPPITASVSGSACTFIITPGTATFKDKPKNGQAITSPFNDIVLRGLDINYVWDDGLAVPVGNTGIAGSVPANGSSTAQFYPIAGNDLIAASVARDGHTANLLLTFHGITVNGDDVSTTTGGTLVVNSCASAAVGACCTQGGGCNVVSQASCVGALGAYQGDNTSCLTTVCP